MFGNQGSSLPPQVDPSPASEYDDFVRKVMGAKPGVTFPPAPPATMPQIPPQVDPSPASEYDDIARKVMGANPGVTFPPEPVSIQVEPDLRRSIAARRVAAKHLVKKGYVVDFPTPDLKRAGETLEGPRVKRKSTMNPIRRLIKLFTGLGG